MMQRAHGKQREGEGRRGWEGDLQRNRSWWGSAAKRFSNVSDSFYSTRFVFVLYCFGFCLVFQIAKKVKLALDYYCPTPYMVFIHLSLGISMSYQVSQLPHTHPDVLLVSGGRRVSEPLAFVFRLESLESPVTQWLPKPTDPEDLPQSRSQSLV